VRGDLSRAARGQVAGYGGRQMWRGPSSLTADGGCVRQLAVAIGKASPSESRFSRVPSSRGHGLRYVPAGVVWASIVRPSAPSVIFTLRGFADSATGIRRVSTPVS
jgi:hypothetical protein